MLTEQWVYDERSKTLARVPGENSFDDYFSLLHPGDEEDWEEVEVKPK